MKRPGRIMSICLVSCLAPVCTALADKSLASTMDVYVFPTEGQASDQQSMDEAECYQWAVSNSGSDPFELQKQQQAETQQSEAEIQQAQQVGKGAGARGAVGGAAAGALIGEVTGGDAGESAAWGAAAGLVASRRRGHAAQQQATQQAQQQAATTQQATAEEMDNFKKAFSVCLEAKKYMVKY